jgi:hypothetical protein
MNLTFLADENISRHLVNLLREQGYHVSWMRERRRGTAFPGSQGSAYVKGSGLHRFLLLAGQSGEAVREGVGDAEFRQDPTSTTI